MKWLWTATALSTPTLALISSAMATETQSYQYDELGRLKAVQYSGTVNNGQAHSTCFDPAGNRTVYRSDSGGALASCTPTPTPSPTPTPTPTPTNSPPVANPDTATMARCATITLDVTANDTDPEGNLPLTVVSVSGGGGLHVTLVSGGTVQIESTGLTGARSFSYTVADSLGATSVGTGTVTVQSGPVCP